MQTVPLPRHLSIYLDFLRIAAAAIVVLVHIKIMGVGPAGFQQALPGNGQEAVILFFVLSGYVIMASVDRRPGTLTSYAISRGTRIYSVAIPALIITAVIGLGMDMIKGEGLLNALTNHGSSVALTLIGLAESWSLDAVPSANQPFWSLCYEMLYYSIFGCAYFLRGSKRIVCLVALAALAGPKVMILFPCWLFGVLAYRWRDRFIVSHPWLWAVVPALAAVGLLRGLHLTNLIDKTVGVDYDLNHSAYWIKDTLIAALIALHLYAMRFCVFYVPERIAAIIKRGAAMTFTLYVIHFPLLWIPYNASSAIRQSGWTVPAVLGIILLSTYVLSTFTETQRRAGGISTSTAAIPGMNPVNLRS